MNEKISNFFKNFDWSAGSIARVCGVVLIGLVALSVGLTIFGTLLSFGMRTTQTIREAVFPTYTSISNSPPPMARMMAPMGGAMGMVDSYAKKMSYGDGDAEGIAMDMAMPIEQMIAPQPYPHVNGSRNAELYQREGYSATYETRKYKETCEAIEGLKPLAYVIFDSANQAEKYCSYGFRVEKLHADEIVGTLKAFNPKEWNVSTYSVAQGIENTEDRIQILKRRLSSTESTLAEVEQSFARLSSLATQGGKVADLTNIISQKLSMVERLTNEKLSLEEQIRQLTGGKSDQIDETVYAHFSVSVTKWSAIDWQSMKDSWRYRIQETVRSMSDTLSSIVLTVPSIILTLMWYALVLALLILSGTIFIKYMLIAVKKLWNN
jgi:hypothetical protein